MATHKASSDQQSLDQNEASWGKERYMESCKLTYRNNKQQHTIRTMTPPYKNKARNGTCTPSAKPLVMAEGPFRIQPEPVCAVWRPAATESKRDRSRHCTTDSWR
jgi:hypothetical protein